MTFVSKLYFSPVKSLSFQHILKCEVIKNIGIKNDRVIAFSRNVDIEFSKILEKDSYSRNLNNLLTLKNTISLNKYSFCLNENKLTMYLKESKIIEINLNNIDEHYLICKKLNDIVEKIKKPIYLLQNKDFPFF